MDALMPEEQRKEDSTMQTSFDQYNNCWRQWSEVLWPLISKVDNSKPGSVSREEKAKKVHKQALEFIKRWSAATNGTGHLYQHTLVYHLPDQILSYRRTQQSLLPRALRAAIR